MIAIAGSACQYISECVLRKRFDRCAGAVCSVNYVADTVVLIPVVDISADGCGVARADNAACPARGKGVFTACLFGDVFGDFYLNIVEPCFFVKSSKACLALNDMLAKVDVEFFGCAFGDGDVGF